MFVTLFVRRTKIWQECVWQVYGKSNQKCFVIFHLVTGVWLQPLPGVYCQPFNLSYSWRLPPRVQEELWLHAASSPYSGKVGEEDILLSYSHCSCRLFEELNIVVKRNPKERKSVDGRRHSCMGGLSKHLKCTPCLLSLGITISRGRGDIGPYVEIFWYFKM